jgi:hypothetical protein
MSLRMSVRSLLLRALRLPVIAGSVESFHQIFIRAEIRFHLPRFVVDRCLASIYAMPVHLILSDTGKVLMTLALAIFFLRERFCRHSAAAAAMTLSAGPPQRVEVFFDRSIVDVLSSADGLGGSSRLLIISIRLVKNRV